MDQKLTKVERTVNFLVLFKKGQRHENPPPLTPAPSPPPQTAHKSGRQQRPRVVDTLPRRDQYRTRLVVASLGIVGIFDGVETGAVECGGFEERGEVVWKVSSAGGLAGHG